MLKLTKICKSFSNTQVLKDISFEIPKNKIVGLLGPNGAGKTTIMRIITGFLTANQGTLRWKRKIIDPRDPSFRSLIGYLPESNPLYVSFTPVEYLSFVARLKGISKTNLVKEVKKVSQQTDIASVLTKKIETLSKGFKQRVALSATLLGDPQLLVLDEATSGLDPKQILEVRKLIKKLAKDKSILFSTHILPEAKAICDQILIINQGRIVLDSDIKKVRNLEKKFIQLTQ
ncbi:ABC transporter ATP-binding protein [Patescibacteria group bacterium]|nr:ABC transporter ATP-binding protein [Patescibacteria group bacterium]